MRLSTRVTAGCSRADSDGGGPWLLNTTLQHATVYNDTPTTRVTTAFCYVASVEHRSLFCVRRAWWKSALIMANYMGLVQLFPGSSLWAWRVWRGDQNAARGGRRPQRKYWSIEALLRTLLEEEVCSTLTKRKLKELVFVALFHRRRWT